MLFAGRAAAVDEWLIQRGLLRRLERAEDLPRVTRRGDRLPALENVARRGRAILETFVDVTPAPRAGAGAGAGGRQAGVVE